MTFEEKLAQGSMRKVILRSYTTKPLLSYEEVVEIAKLKFLPVEEKPHPRCYCDKACNCGNIEVVSKAVGAVIRELPRDDPHLVDYCLQRLTDGDSYNASITVIPEAMKWCILERHGTEVVADATSVYSSL